MHQYLMQELAAAKADRIARAPQLREERAAELRAMKAAAAAEAARKAQAFGEKLLRGRGGPGVLEG
jgi:hypothetical protein